jgi:hypothetical protein
MKNKISNLEKKLEEQEQYSRRTSLRFSNVGVPTNGNNVVKTPIAFSSFFLLKTMCLWRYVRKRTIIEILPSRISPIERDLPMSAKADTIYTDWVGKSSIVMKRIRDNPYTILFIYFVFCCK